MSRPHLNLRRCTLFVLAMLFSFPEARAQQLRWQTMPAIPDQLGLAGAVVGVHNEVVLAGGGTNFAEPVWESTKQWHSSLYAFDLSNQATGWQRLGEFPILHAYAACVSTPRGIVAIGGNDASHEFRECWLLQIQRIAEHKFTVNKVRLPDLPSALVYAQAAYVAERIVVLTGQTGAKLDSAIAGGWELEWPQSESPGDIEPEWRFIDVCPGGPRAFAIVTRTTTDATKDKDQDIADDASLLVIGGRRQHGDEIEFLRDTWTYDIVHRSWQQRADMPVPISAGGGAPIATNRVAVVSGDDGSLFSQTERLRDQHPGFPKRAWLYDVAADRWTPTNETPANQVTTLPVSIGQSLWLISGEVRPRVRTNRVWKIDLEPSN